MHKGNVMIRKNFGVFLLLMALAIWWMPSASSALTLTGGDPSGYVAWDNGGDVIGEFGDTDQRWNSEFTGVYYNAAGFLGFGFTIDDSYPNLNDIMNNPLKDWQWQLRIENLVNPFNGAALPTIQASGVNSYADFQSGADWVGGFMSNLFDFNSDYIFDCTFTGPNTGFASLSMVGNIDPNWWQCLPNTHYQGYQSNARVAFSVSSVPEPMTLVLFSLGLTGLGLIRNRKS